MKFKLEPKWQQISDEKLLDNLRHVAKQLRKHTVTKREYLKHGKFGQQTLAKRFGGWFRALSRAGLSTDRPTAISPAECITDLRRVAKEIGKDSVSLAEYRKSGRYSERPFIRNFGTWKKALKSAELCVSPHFRSRVSDEEYFENLQRIWIILGRQPKYSEIEKPLSVYSAHAYEQRFGSWRKALEAFVSYVQQEETDTEKSADPPQDSLTTASPADSLAAESSARKIRSRRTPRQPSERLWFRVVRRDNFTCRICGRNLVLHPGLELQVDHVVPWEQGGETVLDNLQTLCARCNRGKSNLPMHDPEESTFHS